jgi:hypothetical protein
MLDVDRQHIDRLDQRCKWLTARIAAKKSVGWETVYDESERDALLWALVVLRQEKEAEAMKTDNATVGQSKGAKVVAGINDATDIISTLVPTVAALGGLVRLIATAVRPTDAQKAQAFDAAIAEFDTAKAGLDAAVDGFEQAKAQAAAAKPAGNPVSAMGAKTSGSKPSDG